jgi:hypothetical protein
MTKGKFGVKKLIGSLYQGYAEVFESKFDREVGDILTDNGVKYKVIMVADNELDTRIYIGEQGQKIFE